jgi:hypothetical protein
MTLRNYCVTVRNVMAFQDWTNDIVLYAAYVIITRSDRIT